MLGVVLSLGFFYGLKWGTTVAPGELQFLTADLTRHIPKHWLVINRQVSRSLKSGKPSLIPRFLVAYADAKSLTIRNRRAEAAAKLGAMGTNAVSVIPALAAALNDPDSEVRWVALAVLCRMQAHRSPFFEQVKLSLKGRSRPIPELVWVLETGNSSYYQPWPLGPESRRFVLLCLTACASTPALVPMLTNLVFSKGEDIPNRALAVAALAWHGRDVPAVYECLRTILLTPAEWPEIRAAAGCSLVGKMPHNELLTAFRGMLQSSEARARVGGAEGLWELRAPTGEILPVLQKALSHHLPSVRSAALKVIEKMGDQASYLKGSIETLLTDPKEVVRREATNTLVRLESTTSHSIHR